MENTISQWVNNKWVRAKQKHSQCLRLIEWKIWLCHWVLRARTLLKWNGDESLCFRCLIYFSGKGTSSVCDYLCYFIALLFGEW